MFLAAVRNGVEKAFYSGIVIPALIVVSRREKNKIKRC
jgi:hypothetical protein